jgi:hypothetical protein
MAQKTTPDVKVAKDGLVTVNGKSAFYMISKSVVPWESDYGLENLKHEQLAYFKLAKGYKYTSNSSSHQEIMYYVLSFNYGPHCEVRDYLGYGTTIISALAAEIVEAGIIKNGALSEEAIKKFIEKHNGFMTADKEAPDTTAKYLSSAIERADGDSLNGKITLKEGFIYYGQTIIGTFKTVAIDTDFTLVQVYSVNKNKVAEATYVKGANEWKLVTIVDEKRSTLPYDDKYPMEELFRHLLRKRYL